MKGQTESGDKLQGKQERNVLPVSVQSSKPVAVDFDFTLWRWIQNSPLKYWYILLTLSTNKSTYYTKIYIYIYIYIGDRGGTVVKVLCYKSEGRWFDPSWCQWIFRWHKSLLIALWPWGRLSLQQKWVPGVFPGRKGGRCARLITYHHPVPLSRNLGTLTSWNPLGLSRPVMRLLYIYIYIYHLIWLLHVSAGRHFQAAHNKIT